jgi:gliding motility-associated-like protein
MPALSLNNNIVAALFGGNPIVRWGFTSSMFGAIIGGGTGPEPLPRSPRVQYYFGKITPDFTTSPKLDTCFGPPVQFIDRSIYDRNDLVNSLNLAKWYWDFGNGNTSSLRQPLPQVYPAPGIYTVRYTVTNQIGCTVDTIKRVIRLAPKPQAEFAFSKPCLGDSLRFTDLSQGSIDSVRNWYWTFDDGWRTSVARHPVMLPPRPGPYTVSLTARSELGCQSDTVRKIIDIKPRPEADFSWVRDCYGKVSFTGIPVTGQASNWQWQFGDGTQGEGPGPVHQYAKDDTFQAAVVAISPEGCPSDTVRNAVDVKRVFAQAGRDTIIAKGQPLQLNALVSSNDIAWQPQLGLSDPYIANPAATLERDQTYFLKVINPDGCTAEDTIHIRVFNEATVFVPNAFTPNGDGKNDVLRMIAPGIRVLHVFSIFNRWGELVFSTGEIGKGWNGTVKGKDAMPGAYVWQADVTDYLGNRKVHKGTLVLIR